LGGRPDGDAPLRALGPASRSASRRALILADSSAWIEFLRRTGSRTNRRMRELLGDPDQVAVTDAVVMEVLAGARDTPHRDELGRLLWRCWFAPTDGPGDYE